MPNLAPSQTFVCPDISRPKKLSKPTRIDLTASNICMQSEKGKMVSMSIVLPNPSTDRPTYLLPGPFTVGIAFIIPIITETHLAPPLPMYLAGPGRIPAPATAVGPPGLHHFLQQRTRRQR